MFYRVRSPLCEDGGDHEKGPSHFLTITEGVGQGVQLLENGTIKTYTSNSIAHSLFNARISNVLYILKKLHNLLNYGDVFLVFFPI